MWVSDTLSVGLFLLLVCVGFFWVFAGVGGGFSTQFITLRECEQMADRQ